MAIFVSRLVQEGLNFKAIGSMVKGLCIWDVPGSIPMSIKLCFTYKKKGVNFNACDIIDHFNFSYKDEIQSHEYWPCAWLGAW